MTCITSINYTMKADIYKPYVEQDDIGAVKRTFVLEKTIDCLAKTLISPSSKNQNTAGVSLNQYINFLTAGIKIRTSMPISIDRKIVMIRNQDGVIWKETEDPASGGGFNGSTIFEVKGSTPIFNFDGSVIEYEILLTRQENQRLS